ncbi:MAG: discoidin domain-containing protein [Sedimentisphaerales bacterium]|nr:discoidin domain-containing protein [Sedimentisphaerales bacterium]
MKRLAALILKRAAYGEISVGLFGPAVSIRVAFCLLGAFLSVCVQSSFGAALGMWSVVEADWLRQAEAWVEKPKPPQTFEDARGAVDGVKDGKYGFHVGHQANPWWQVELASEPIRISRIVVYNRLDYAPGLHNADNLIILTSDDGNDWSVRHRNGGKFFGGIAQAEPLDVRFEGEGISARYVRLMIPSEAPIFFHLDEVEIYAPAKPNVNLALGRPVDQSSTSPWSTAKGRDNAAPAAAYPIEHFLERGRRLAGDMRRMSVRTKEYEAQLDGLEDDYSKLDSKAADEVRRKLYFEVRRVVRELAFANPLLDFAELLFVKRFTQETYPDICLNHMPWVSRPGGDICVLTMAGPEAEPKVRQILNGTLGPGHVRGIDLWWDADRVVFGYAKAGSNDPPEGWKDRVTNYDLRRTEEPIHIFEVNIDGTGLRQITDGQWSDLDPTYAPNGDIVFVSERCGCSLQCNEYDKDETSCNLFSCKPDGSSIRWLSVSKDGDYLPHTLADGTIGYTRWEYQERGWAHIQSIWVIRPDGTGADALFKQHFNDPWAIEDARSIPGLGTSKLSAVAAGHHTLATGPVVVVTPSAGMNSPKGIKIVTPGVSPPEGGMSGSTVDQGGVFDSGGYYTTVWPLSEKYFLACYSYSNDQTSPAGYGIYLIDVFGTKELLYRDGDISSFTPIPLKVRPRPPVLPDMTDPNESYAICSVANATYGVDGVAAGQARYLRISERLRWPYDNKFGGHRYTEKAYPNNWTPVRVIGTAPIESDGSVHFRVPADTPVYFQLLDKNHMELRRMRSFISFQPGEVRGCVGCHETREEAPRRHNTRIPLALRREPLDPTPPAWGRQPISFLRDIQPILDEHCVTCHSGLSPAGGLDFYGGLTAGPRQGPGHSTYIPGYGFNRAFETIIQHKLVCWSEVQGDSRVTQPLEFGSHKSRLVEVLRSGPCAKRANLSRAEWLRLVTWIDGNAPYHDRFVDKRQKQAAYSLPADAALLDSIKTVHEKRCSACHKTSDVTRLDWVDIYRPDQSLFLAAPLAESAGGTAACGQAVYTDCNDPDYRTVLGLVNDAVEKSWEHPRRDLITLQKQWVSK